MSLMVVKLRSTLCLVEVPVKVTQLALEILFLLIKTKPDIAGLKIFDPCYLYSAYADDTTFLLMDTISIKNMVDALHFFRSSLD